MRYVQAYVTGKARAACGPREQLRYYQLSGAAAAGMKNKIFELRLMI